MASNFLALHEVLVVVKDRQIPEHVQEHRKFDLEFA